MEECQSNGEARERTLPSNILAVIEIQKEEPKSYLRTIASEHVSLIVAATSNDEELKKGKTPPINVLTVWFVAFCEQYFDPMLDWVMRDCVTALCLDHALMDRLLVFAPREHSLCTSS